MVAEIANKKKAKLETKSPRPRGNPAWKKGGESPNPKGRPKDGESWSGIIRAVGEMYSDDLLAFIGKDNDMGREIVKYPKNVQLKYLTIIRAYSSFLFDPSSSMLRELIERLEGKVPDKVQFENELRVDGLNEMLDRVWRPQ